MRVTHLIPALFAPNGNIIGGAERYAFELARYMARELPTRLVSFADEAREEVFEGLHLRVIAQPWYVRGQRSNPVAANLLTELPRADIIHCHQQHILISSLTALGCRATNRKVFVSDLGGGGWDISAYISTDGWYHGHLHISEYSRRIYGHAACPRAHVILGGVDTGKFSPDEAQPRDANMVLFVGRLLPHKGIDDLIKALPAGMRLEIIGDSDYTEYKTELRRLAAGKQVEFRHDVDDAGLVTAYRRAGCVVLPSVYRTMYGEESKVPELLGQTLLEGMACGAPAVCTDVASLPEVVEDGICGFIVPPNDPVTLGARLEWLRDHPEKARLMGVKARAHVLDKFVWSAVVRRCLEIYTR